MSEIGWPLLYLLLGIVGGLLGWYFATIAQPFYPREPMDTFKAMQAEWELQDEAQARAWNLPK